MKNNLIYKDYTERKNFETNRKKVENNFYIKIIPRERPFLSRLASYGRYGSDTNSVTPDFINTIRCSLYVCQDHNFIHKV